MDLTQLSQMVGWLDEEHRRDRDELAKLDQRLQALGIENQQQARRIQDLEGRLAGTQAELVRFAQIDQALQQIRNEMTAMLDKHAEARMQAERESDRTRLSDRESLSRSIGEVRKELSRISALEEELKTRQAEDRRLSEMLLALRQSINNTSKELDERTRSLPYMVEQRSQDNKRIAQIQAENMELIKRVDATAGKLPLLQELVQRLDREFKTIHPIPDQIRQEQQKFIEQMKVSDIERLHYMAEWSEQVEHQQALVDQHSGRIQEFAAQYEEAGRAIKQLAVFQDEIVREQRQVSELQRLAEERQRKELAEWQTEDEQRWKKEQLRWEYAQQEQQKVNERLKMRFPALEQDAVHLKREIEALWRMQEALGERRLQEAQKMSETIGAGLDGRPKPEI